MFIFLLHPKSVFRNSFFTEREGEREIALRYWFSSSDQF